MPFSNAETFEHAQTTRSLRKFLDGISDATLLVSREYRVLYGNGEARARFPSSALTFDQPLEEFFAVAFPGATWEPVKRQLDALLATPDAEPLELLIEKNGRQVPMRVTVLDFDSDCHCGELETHLALSFVNPDADTIMRRLEVVLNASTDGVFIVNRTNQIVFFNKACERLTGWKRGAEMLQTYECQNVLRCHNNDGESMAGEGLCPAKVFFQRESIPKPHEMLITTTDGRERWVETNYSPIKNSGGEVEYIVGIIRDIDERKRLESQLIQSKNMALLGQLVSGIAHEIKNPLGILMSSVEVVLNESQPERARREAAGFIKDEVRRLDCRMKEFLAFARPKPMLAEPVDIDQVMQRSLAAYATVRNPMVRVEMRLSGALPLTVADPDLLHQVFLNLVLNAEQAMPEGGTLVVSTKALGEEGSAPDTIRISFVDEGTGIAEGDLPRIFDPFFTTKPEGTGLGLSVVHQIVTSHGGRMHVRNNDAAPGVTFEILLPIRNTD